MLAQADIRRRPADVRPREQSTSGCKSARCRLLEPERTPAASWRRALLLIACNAGRMRRTSLCSGVLPFVNAPIHCDIQASLATFGEAQGDYPGNSFGVIAGEALEGRQRKDDLTSPSEIHLRNNGRLDWHLGTPNRTICCKSTMARKWLVCAGAAKCRAFSERIALLANIHRDLGAAGASYPFMDR